jgi:hypothetical protein
MILRLASAWRSAGTTVTARRRAQAGTSRIRETFGRDTLRLAELGDDPGELEARRVEVAALAAGISQAQAAGGRLTHEALVSG